MGGGPDGTVGGGGPGSGDRVHSLATYSWIRPPWWATILLVVLSMILVVALLGNGLITIRLVNKTNSQQAQLNRQRAEFCREEYEIKAKITELEVEMGTYFYVIPVPVCRR